MCLANRKLFINNQNNYTLFFSKYLPTGMSQKALVLETTNFSKNELATAFDLTS